MASNLVVPSAEQCCIIKFLEKVKPAEIVHRLSVQYGKETFKCRYLQLVQYVVEECTEVSNLPHAHVQATAVCYMNICDAEDLILRNK
jgi:hypothetical protein